MGTRALFTDFAEIRFLCKPESTSASAADAPLSGSKIQTNTLRAAGAHPIQCRQQMDPRPNATVMGAQRDNSENGGKPQLKLEVAKPTISSAGSAPDLHRAPLEAAARAAVSLHCCRASHSILCRCTRRGLGISRLPPALLAGRVSSSEL